MKKNRLQIQNEENIKNINLKKFAEVQKLSKSWNPIPQRGSTLPRLQSTVERHSNFINTSKGYFNKGKYKGIQVKDVNKQYLQWVKDNIHLNISELKLIKKYLP
jgi:hypothetical protein